MKRCPQCGQPKRAPGWKRALSWPLIIGGIAFAVPTVGISLVGTVYAAFLRQPPDCDC